MSNYDTRLWIEMAFADFENYFTTSILHLLKYSVIVKLKVSIYPEALAYTDLIDLFSGTVFLSILLNLSPNSHCPFL